MRFNHLPLRSKTSRTIYFNFIQRQYMAETFHSCFTLEKKMLLKKLQEKKEVEKESDNVATAT